MVLVLRVQAVNTVLHILGGIALLLLAVWLGWRTAHIEHTTSAKLSDKVINFITLGSSPTKEGWLWRLRAANLVMAVIALIGAIALFATA